MKSKPEKTASVPAKALARPSLVDAAVEVLQQGMSQGEWQQVLPGERRLCARYQISRPTLRQALSRLEKEGWITSEHGKSRRILPRPGSDSTPPGQRRIAFLSAQELTLMEPFAVLEIDELRRRLADLGYRLEVIGTPALSRSRTGKELEQCVQGNPAAAWILYRAPRAVQAWFLDRGYPAVIMGTAHPDIRLASVDLDFRATCRHAVGLLRGRGHAPERLALLAPSEALAGIDESKAGFLEGLGIAPKTADPRIITHRDRDDVCRQLDRLFTKRGPSPTGLIVQRPIYALSSLGYLMARLNLTPPRDLSLVSLDDEPSLRYAIPEITRYTKHPARYARQLAKSLVQAMEGRIGNRAGRNRFMPDLIPGDTLGPPPA